MIERIEKLETEKKSIDKKYFESIKELEKEKRNLQQECERKLLLLKEREKELKINQIKVKEISKLIKNQRFSDQNKDAIRKK